MKNESSKTEGALSDIYASIFIDRANIRVKYASPPSVMKEL